MREQQNKLKLFNVLVAQAPRKVFAAILLGIVAGLAYSLLIPLLLMTLQVDPLTLQTEPTTPLYFGDFEISNPKIALCFLILCVIVLLARSFSAIILNDVSVEATVSLREYLYSRISQLPIADIERIGSSRLLTMLTIDVPRLVNGASAFPLFFVSGATLTGLLGFLIYLNISVFYFTMGFILFGVLTYRIPLSFGQRLLLRARERMDRIQEGARGLIYGAKELKLNREKRAAFIAEELHANEAAFESGQKVGTSLMIFSSTYGELISFATIGFVVFAMANFYELSTESLMGVVMTLLYITGPIGSILGALRNIVQASVSLKSMQRLLADMPVEAESDSKSPKKFQKLTLKNIVLRYRSSTDIQSFELGPLSLTFKKGEVTFLVGGNGSGKTTLGKVISLHYVPDGGDIYFDDERVDVTNRAEYRQSIAAIFADFHVFPKLFGIDTDNVKDSVDAYLNHLGLADKVSIDGGRLSTTKLSSGQMKRLALLVAYLENREIYIFDEWAADQDPEFKNVFYHRILPGLKSQKKIIVVISHDDRYFHVADKVVRLEDGKVSGDEKRKVIEAVI